MHRLYTIDNLIREGGYPSVSYFARETGVHPRTIYRDIEYFRDRWGAPLLYDREKEGYYYSEPSWKFFPMALTEQELIALLLAKNSILHYAGVPYEPHLRSAFRKITEFLPDDKAINLGDMEKTFSFRFGSVRPVDPRVLDTVSKALQHRNCLKIVYHAAGTGEVSERMIDPYNLDNFAGVWYLLAFCRLRDGMRMFALNRIKSCTLLAKRFEIPEGFSYALYIRDAFGILLTEDPVDIAVEFSGFDARLAKESSRHESQRIEEREDGTVVVRLRVTGIEEVKRWILSSGKGAKVLEPPWLADAVAKEHREAAAQYYRDGPGPS
jgi:predicted DNA-binding transcriptional regulator YafY